MNIDLKMKSLNVQLYYKFILYTERPLVPDLEDLSGLIGLFDGLKSATETLVSILKDL